MNKTNLIAIVVLIGIILLGTGIYFAYQNRLARLEETGLEPASLPTPVTTFPVASQSPSPRIGASVNSQPASGISDSQVKKIGITILEPRDNSLISTPVIVRGYANVFEGLVQLRLKDANGNVLGTNTAMGCMGEEACPFEVPLIFSKSQTASGTLESFTYSPKDGSVENLITVPITF